MHLRSTLESSGQEPEHPPASTPAAGAGAARDAVPEPERPVDEDVLFEALRQELL